MIKDRRTKRFEFIGRRTYYKKIRKESVIKTKCHKDKNNKKRFFLQHKEVFLKNAIKLYDKRTDIINTFANKYIIYGVSEPESELKKELESEQEHEPKFEETIGQRVEKRTLKKPDNE